MCGSALHPDAQASLHREYTSKSLVSALVQVRAACVAASRDSGGEAGWRELGLHVPVPSFACCSWWPGVGAGEEREDTPRLTTAVTAATTTSATVGGQLRRRVSDGGGSSTLLRAAAAAASAAPLADLAKDDHQRQPQGQPRWLDAVRAAEIISGMATAAARSVDTDAGVGSSTTRTTTTKTASTPAGAAIRALALLQMPLGDGDRDRGGGGDRSRGRSGGVGELLDAVWITAGISTLGGGGGEGEGGGGEWPPEAVAAFGTLKAAQDAGARVSIVLLLPSPPHRIKNGTNSTRKCEGSGGAVDLPPIIAAVASRLGAPVRFLSSGSSSFSGSGPGGANTQTRPIVDAGLRWRGNLIVPVTAPEVAEIYDRGRATAAAAARILLPDVYLSSGFRDYGSKEETVSGDGNRVREERGGEAPASTSASTSTSTSTLSLRAGSDMLLLEVVRLEMVPPSHMSPRVPLHFAAGEGKGSVGIGDSGGDDDRGGGKRGGYGWCGEGNDGGGGRESGRRGRDIRDGFLAAWSALTKVVPPKRGPAFIVRIAFPTLSAGAGAGVRSGWQLSPPPLPHETGPLLLIFADGDGGFVAAALASAPLLLHRALAHSQGLAARMAAAEGATRASGGTLELTASGRKLTPSVAKKSSHGGRSHKRKVDDGDTDVEVNNEQEREAEEAKEEEEGALCGGLDGDEDSEARDKALRSVMGMEVLPSTSAAVAAGAGDRGAGAVAAAKRRIARRSNLRLAQDGSSPAVVVLPASSPPSSNDARQGERSASATPASGGGGGRRGSGGGSEDGPFTGYGASRTLPLPIEHVINALVDQQEADDDEDKAAAAASAAAGESFGAGDALPLSQRSDRNTADQPFFTGVLLRAVADLATGREVIGSAIQSASAAAAADAAAQAQADETWAERFRAGEGAGARAANDGAESGIPAGLLGGGEASFGAHLALALTLTGGDTAAAAAAAEPSRSHSRSGTSSQQQQQGQQQQEPMKWAAAEAELQDRRRREQQAGGCVLQATHD